MYINLRYSDEHNRHVGAFKLLLICMYVDDSVAIDLFCLCFSKCKVHAQFTVNDLGTHHLPCIESPKSLVQIEGNHACTLLRN